MKRINKAVVGNEAPIDHNVFWVDVVNPENPVLRLDMGGVWKAVAGSSGGSEDAIKYTEQTLTETQQMQARKNQGLYNKKTVPGFTITWDGDTTGRDVIVIDDNTALYKVADNPRTIVFDMLQSLTYTEGLETSEVPLQELLCIDGSSELQSGNAVAIAFADGNYPISYFFDKAVFPNGIEYNGVYFSRWAEEDYSEYASSLICDDGEAIDRIPAEYIPDLTIYTETENGQLVIKSGVDRFSDFVNALKGGPGSPKFVIYDTTHNRFFINQTFLLEVEYALEGEDNSVTISTYLLDRNNTQAGITANFDSEGHYTNISAYIQGNE